MADDCKILLGFGIRLFMVVLAMTVCGEMRYLEMQKFCHQA